MRRYLIGFLAMIGLGILLLVLLFGGGSKPNKPTKPVTILPDYANTNAQVSVDIDGPIVAPSNHNSAIITVDQNDINFSLIQGYDGNVIASKDYNNSENSFRNFLYAIYYAGFSVSVKSNYSSSIGICPMGDRYDFYLTENGNTLQHTWITNCGNDTKTFGGNFGVTLQLFQKQVADYDTLTETANF